MVKLNVMDARIQSLRQALRRQTGGYTKAKLSALCRERAVMSVR